MDGVAGQIVLGVVVWLITAALGFLGGWAWKRSHPSKIYWQARRFWKPLNRGEIKIVVDRFTESNAPMIAGWELSGLVGVGGMQASAGIVGLLEDLGLQGPRRKAEIVYHDQVEGDIYEHNLICIGGPDANDLTKMILGRIEHSISPGVPGSNIISVRDLQTGARYNPKSEINEQGRTVVTLDHGVMIKVQNPWKRERCIFILAGSYGYGTWAAAKLLRSSEFLATSDVKRGLDVECLFKCEILKEVPQEPEIIVTRLISGESGSRQVNPSVVRAAIPPDVSS